MILDSLYSNLSAADIPVEAISMEGGRPQLIFAPHATIAQRIQGETLAEQWDLTIERAAENSIKTMSSIVEANILDTFNELRQFRDRTSTTLSVVATITILKTICRVLIWLGRIQLKKFDSPN